MVDFADAINPTRAPLMTIDAMMAEIRKVYPEAYTYRRMSKPYQWVVAAHDGSGKVLAEGPTEWRVVESAYNAIRKSRPKPMTVAEAKVFVRSKRKPIVYFHKSSGIWSISFSKAREGLALLGDGLTEGQAWKAAAAAIQASEAKEMAK